MKQNNKSKPLVIIQCYEDRQQTLPLKKADNNSSEAIAIANGHSQKEAIDDPPPPPPMPIRKDTTQNGEVKQTLGQIQEKINSQITNGSNLKISMNNSIKTNETSNGLSRTPTPDYNKTETLAQIKLQNKSKEEKAELESLESYKLKNPSSLEPKPPSNYFMRAPNGTATMKKLTRPVSVTIGEYGSVAGVKRQPSKLGFLNGVDKPDGSPKTDDVPITNRLQSELALTLSRSNLRKKTETLVDGGR